MYNFFITPLLPGDKGNESAKPVDSASLEVKCAKEEEAVKALLVTGVQAAQAKLNDDARECAKDVIVTVVKEGSTFRATIECSLCRSKITVSRYERWKVSNFITHLSRFHGRDKPENRKKATKTGGGQRSIAQGQSSSTTPSGTKRDTPITSQRKRSNRRQLSSSSGNYGPQ